LALLVTACGKGGDNDQGLSNVDCEPGVLVNGQCTTDPEDCGEPGPFVDLGDLSLQHGQTLHELHVTLGPGSAAHYCYAALENNEPEGFYGVQTSSTSATEEPITNQGKSVICAALAVDDLGNRFVLSRDAQVLTSAASGAWTVVALPGLDSQDVLGALQNDQTVATLTPDGSGGVYVGLSLGFNVGAQPAYVALVKDAAATALLDGWAEGTSNQVAGHVPQVLPGEPPLVVMGDLVTNEIVLADASLSVLDRQEGVMPFGLETQSGGRVLYADHNGLLQISSVEQGKLSPFTTLRLVGRADTGAQLPWVMAQAKDDALDVLADVDESGTRALVHWRVDSKGQVGAEEILSTSLWTHAKGGQRFANRMDMCGRTTAVILEQDEDENPKLRLFEQR
jgi:hypothetical protein